MYMLSVQHTYDSLASLAPKGRTYTQVLLQHGKLNFSLDLQVGVLLQGTVGCERIHEPNKELCS